MMCHARLYACRAGDGDADVGAIWLGLIANVKLKRDHLDSRVHSRIDHMLGSNLSSSPGEHRSSAHVHRAHHRDNVPLANRNPIYR